MKKRARGRRVMVLIDKDLTPPDTLEGHDPNEMQDWRMEFDVISTLKKSGHEVLVVGVTDELTDVRKAVEEFKPHIAFNLLEEFASSMTMVHNVVGFLELSQVQYTGCNPRGLMLALDKALTKKILAYHRIPVPQFQVFPLRRRIQQKTKLKFPLLVKSLVIEGSVGISQASVVYDHEHLVERIEFIHRTVNTHAIAEEYIEGREFYVAVMGNSRLDTFTPWELIIEKLPEGAPNIATLKVKWDLAYQQKVGVKTQAARDLSPAMQASLAKLSKRIYRLLELSGYARLDFRLREDGKFFLIEANPNPNICQMEDFAMSALDCGVKYPKLLERIMQLGLQYEHISLA